MSQSVLAKKSGILIAFVLFSFIFLGIIVSLTNDISVKAGSDFSYPSWLIISHSWSFWLHFWIVTTKINHIKDAIVFKDSKVYPE